MSRLEGWAAKTCTVLVIVLVYVPALLIAAPISLIGEGMVQLSELILSGMEWLEERITKA